jgi:hypothetical protein
MGAVLLDERLMGEQNNRKAQAAAFLTENKAYSRMQFLK